MARTTVDRAEATRRLASWSRYAAATDAGRAAAVALLLFAVEDGPADSTVITRRSADLRSHPGQWALPGGRLDLGETAEDAALREVSEEIGLQLPPESVVGLLDDYVTVSEFCITPVVLWADIDPNRLDANPQEVASIDVVSLHELDVAADLIDDPDLPTPVLRFPFRGRHIHAPTGAILFQFRELVLHGRSSRVHMYSSPRRLDHRG